MQSHDEIGRLIERSSMGTPAVRRLRARTPGEVVANILSEVPEIPWDGGVELHISLRTEELPLQGRLATPMQGVALKGNRGGRSVSDKKVVFIAFAKEDESSRNLFTGQRVNAKSPVEFIDMSVKQPYDSGWKDKTRTRIRRSDGVIALISSNTPTAAGELWEISCAVEERKPLLGIWIEQGYRTKPKEMGSAPCKIWTWANVAEFIDQL